MTVELVAPIALMLVFVKPDGETIFEFRPQASSEVCWVAAKRFIMHDLREFGDVIAIGAGCIIHPDGRGAEK